MTFTESMITAAIEWLESAEDFALFDSKMLGKLQISNELMPYLSAVLKSIPFYAASSLKASKRRFICFQKSITLLKAGKLLEHQGKELLNRCRKMSHSSFTLSLPQFASICFASLLYSTLLICFLFFYFLFLSSL